MPNLEPIKKRLRAHRKGEYGPVPVDGGAQWLVDIRALVAEVESLQALLKEIASWHDAFPSGDRQFDIATSRRLFTKIADALDFLEKENDTRTV